MATEGSATGPKVVVAGAAALAAAALAFVALYKPRRSKASSAEEQLEALYEKFPEVANEQDSLGLRVEPARYVELLAKLVGESEHVQNFPPDLVPQESRVVRHVLDVLEPYTKAKGGPLEVQEVAFVEGRSNLIIKYPGRSPSSKTIGLLGSHLDVVPAVKENWVRDPFHLTVEGDKLYARGTTDCLGHVAMLTLLFEELAKKRPALESNVVAVFIASEEASDKPGTGVDGLRDAGMLKELQNGTCLWIDSSDSEPCIGTAGALQWHLTATGKRFHSGFPDAAINPIELASDALKLIQDRFYKAYPPHPEEARYKFLNPTTIKPTQMKCAKGGLNQIPPTATLSGDIRLTPFYDPQDVIKRVEGWVEELNSTTFAALPRRGPVSEYELPKEGRKGLLKLEWGHLLDKTEIFEGIACNLDSPAFLALCDSVKAVRGDVKPFSICGSLPLVRSMQAAGFDLQIVGFGRSDAYHAENEYCLLSDMINAVEILSRYISKLDAHNK